MVPFPVISALAAWPVFQEMLFSISASAGMSAWDVGYSVGCRWAPGMGPASPIHPCTQGLCLSRYPGIGGLTGSCKAALAVRVLRVHCTYQSSVFIVCVSVSFVYEFVCV